MKSSWVKLVSLSRLCNTCSRSVTSASSRARTSTRRWWVTCRAGAVRTCTRTTCASCTWWSSRRTRRSSRRGSASHAHSRNTSPRSCCTGSRPRSRRGSRGNSKRVRGTQAEEDPNQYCLHASLILGMSKKLLITLFVVWMNSSKIPLLTYWRINKTAWLSLSQLTAFDLLSTLKLHKKNNS